MTRWKSLLAVALGLVPAAAQTVSAVRVEKAENAPSGRMIVTVDGQEVKLPARAVRAWVAMGGAAVVYTSTQGRGGPGSEGQSLHLWTASTGNTRLVAAESAQIVDVKEAQLKGGSSVFLLNMQGRGPSVAAATTRRSIFWRKPLAQATGVEGSKVTIGEYAAEDVQGVEDVLALTPRKTSTIDMEEMFQADASARAEKKAAKKK